jgi:hypothetical protein
VKGALALALALSGCALPVVSAGTFLPAGDLKKHDLHVSASMEMGRVLAGPTDVDGIDTTSPLTQKFEVSTWLASDLSARYGVSDRVALEAQVKLTNPISPFEPNLVGGALGTRIRFVDRAGDVGSAVELGLRAVGITVEQTLSSSSGTNTRTDVWRYQAIGAEVPLIGSYRINHLFAVTVSPFLRAYWIRVRHSVESTVAPPTENRLEWTPVLTAGIGLSGALQVGPVELAPGMAVELATRPGRGQRTQLLFEPGLSIGTKF